MGLLSRVDSVEWCFLSFVIPKKNGTVRFVKDFRLLNKLIRMNLYPLPRIQDTIMTIGKFTYVTIINLVMSFYAMLLVDECKKYCSTVLPWGTYSYNMLLPMGLCISTDVFQARLGKLFGALENISIGRV